MFFKACTSGMLLLNKKLKCGYRTAYLSCATVWIAVLGSLNAHAQEEKAVLNAEPERCVALHRGQNCYQKIKFSWSVQAPGEYCLKIQGEEQPVECWSGVARGTIPVVFESAQDLVYQLVDRKSDRSLAIATIKVAWVYKSNRRRNASWRLF